MTIRKQLKKAMEMPTLKGMEADTFFIGECTCTTALSWQEEAIARVRAIEAYRSANHAGIGMTAEEVNAQEKWERILLTLEHLQIPQYPIERIEL